MIRIKKLNIHEIELIFNSYIINDFPRNETRPLDKMLLLFNDNRYICFGLFEDDEIIGYAFFIINKSINSLLMDYFATVSKYRGKGFGSIFMKLLANELEGYKILAEVESIESSANDLEKHIRERRISFYTNLNFIVSNVKCDLFGVNYSILYHNKETKEDEIYDLIRDIYKSVFDEYFFNNHIKFEKKIQV